MKKVSFLLTILIMVMVFAGCSGKTDALYEKDGVSIKIENLGEIKFLGEKIDDFSDWEKMHSDGTMAKLQAFGKTTDDGIIHLNKGYFAGVVAKEEYKEEEKSKVSKYDSYAVPTGKWIIALADINYTEQDLDSMKSVINEYLEENKDIQIDENKEIIELYPLSANALDTDYKVMIPLK